MQTILQEPASGAAAAGDRTGIACVPIPETHRDLIDGPYWAALTTLMPGGQPQITPVWCNRAGQYVLTNTMRGFRKERNMQADPRVALLVNDPRNPLRNIEVRGWVVEMTETGAVAHDDELARLYLGNPAAHFFGDAVPAALAARYCPIKVTIAPRQVRVESPDAPDAPPTPPEAGEHPGPLPAGAPGPIPDSHRDLFTRPVHGVLATLMPDGQPQASLVWVDYDGNQVLLNTTLERQKGRNMQADPRVALLVVDPANAGRWIAVRGQVAAITPVGAIAHADRLTRRYTGKAHFYGDIYSPEQQARETRVIVRIQPGRVSLDAIFG
jgi:PPOX class probable F420-dependent enzyme